MRRLHRGDLRDVDRSARAGFRIGYGITQSRLGKTRPESQIGTCNRDDAVRLKSCQWRWVRVHIRGWYRARGWEATYCARYVARKDHRPLGMKRCL